MSREEKYYLRNEKGLHCKFCNYDNTKAKSNFLLENINAKHIICFKCLCQLKIQLGRQLQKEEDRQRFNQALGMVLDHSLPIIERDICDCKQTVYHTKECIYIKFQDDIIKMDKDTFGENTILETNSEQNFRLIERARILQQENQQLKEKLSDYTLRNTELSFKIDSLKQCIASMKGKIEQLKQQLKELLSIDQERVRK